jgi:hypothetical protein
MTWVKEEMVNVMLQYVSRGEVDTKFAESS